jgi:hypothetical protein
MTRPIFIVGCPRSGTTLLRNLLRSHPNLSFPPESHFIPWMYRAYGEPASGQEAWRLARRCLSFPRVAPFWGIAASEADFAACRTFAEVTRRLFEIYAAKEGKPRWGDKTPHYVLDIPLLRRLFPDAQIVHLVRDGRDVALSWLRTRFEPGNLYVAARLWKEMVTKGRRDGAPLPSGAYFELRYEALLAAPEATMRSVCAFLDEPYHAAVLSPSPVRHETGRTVRGRCEPACRDAIARDNSGGWRSAMSLRQRTLFESVAGGLLAELGYPVEGLARKISRGERSLWEADHLARFSARKLLRFWRAGWARASLSFGWAMLLRYLRLGPGKPGDAPARD